MDHAPVVVFPLTLTPVKVTGATGKLSQMDSGEPTEIEVLVTTADVPVICTAQLVVVFVASILYVTELYKVPVEKINGKPVPETALPTAVLPELFLNW
jgi:hypothetical protein